MLEHAHHVVGAFLWGVTNAALFVERIQLEHRGIVRTVGQGFGVGDGSLKVVIQIGHDDFLWDGWRDERIGFGIGPPDFAVALM